MRSNPAHNAANSVRITTNIIGKRRRDGFIRAKSSLKRVAMCCETAKGEVGDRPLRFLKPQRSGECLFYQSFQRVKQPIYFGKCVVMSETNAHEAAFVEQPEPFHDGDGVVMPIPYEDALCS